MIMKKLPPGVGLSVFDIKLEATTAGPSPDNNKRTEVFLLGCKKAQQGNPCPGCFNSITWDTSRVEFTRDPVELAAKLNETTPNKYITIGGGEPLDQIDNLIILCKELKKYGYHIFVYTWHDLVKARRGYTTNDMTDNNNKYPVSTAKINELLKYIDILVDGEFDATEKLYEYDTPDGFYGSIGSGNQKIWDVPNMDYRYMRDIIGLKLDSKNNLIYLEKEGDIDVNN